MPKLIVIADDFTGSNDTGVQLAKKGVSVAVALGDTPVKCDIPVINTDSRALQKEDAIYKVMVAVTKNIDKDSRIVFKKIDSTFRGNIGAEIEAAAKAFGATLIVIAAAIPTAKRTTINGICLVNGIPLTKTEFSTDPKTPVKYSDIASIVGCQSNLPCQNITLSHIRSGELGEILQKAQDSDKPQVLILDTETDIDLSIIANILVTISGKIVLVGAAGIANQLPKALFIEKTNLPVLILAGSMSKVTQQQIDHCKCNGLNIIEIDAQDIWHHHDITLSRTIEHAGALLRQGKHCAIRTSRNQDERQRAKLFCLQNNISGTEMGDTVAHFLGQLGKVLMDSYRLSGVLFTGGDIATAVATELGTDGYIIKGEIQACIPYGHFTQHSTTVVTKAGGFGTVDAIENIITYLQDNL